MGGRPRHSDGEIKNHLFKLSESMTSVELGEVAELLFGYTEFSAHGRLGVNSAGTSYQHCGLEFGELPNSSIREI
jgi:hypothetical protein